MMSEIPYNPDDPAFLASRSLDEELPADQRRTLDDALATSESLRAEVEAFRAIDRLVKEWRTDDVELDWTAHRELIKAMTLAEPNDVRDGALDELLAHWAADPAEIDDEALTAAVMARVPGRPRRAFRLNLVFRLGVPLAAAAAVAFAVVGTLQYWSSARPRVEVSIGAMRVATVSFSREPAAGFTPERTSPGMSFMVVGAFPSSEEWLDEPPPL